MKYNRLFALIVVLIFLFSSLSISLGSFQDVDNNSINDDSDTPATVNNIRIETRTNRQTTVEEVADGKLDLFLENVEGKFLEDLNKEPKQNIETWKSEESYHTLFFNPAHTVSPYECKVEGKLEFNPFAIEKVRYAANFLVNRSKIVEEFYGGHGDIRYLPFSRSSPSYDHFKDIVEDNGFTAEGNKHKGIEMITEALYSAMNDSELKGELRKGDDGYWEYRPKSKDSFDDIKAVGRFGFWDEREKIAEYFSDLLRECGIKSYVIKYDYGYGSTVWGSDPADLEWSFYTGGWISQPSRYYRNKEPAEMYAGWKEYMPGGFVHDPDYKYGYNGTGNQTLERVTKRLYENQINNIDQYWEYMEKAIRIGVDESVRIFLSTKNEYYTYNKNKVKTAVTDVITGWSDYFTPRTIYSYKDNLTFAQFSSQGTLYMDNWNEIGGSNDLYGLQHKRMLMDTGAALHPRTGKPIPFRCDWKTEDNKDQVVKDYHWYENESSSMILDKNISVPTDAVDYNTTTQRWENVDKNVKSAVKVTYDVKTGKWHDGHDLTLKDLIANYAFMKELAYKDHENDTWYTQRLGRAKEWYDTIAATKWDEEKDTYTIWGNFTSPVDDEIGKYYTEYSFPVVPHQLYEAAQFLVTQNDSFIPTNTGSYGWENKAENWIHWLSKSQGEDFISTLENMTKKNWMPWYLREENNAPITISQDQYNSEINYLIDFYEKYDHVFSSQGPFFAKSINPEDVYVSFNRFDEEDGYPYNRSYFYNEMAELEVINTVPEDNSITEVSDDDLKVVFSKSMNTSKVPKVEILEGDDPDGWEFKEWSSTNFENDTAIWTNNGWEREQEYKVKTSEYESEGGEIDESYTWNFTVLNNEPPEADAGQDKEIRYDTLTKLNASASSDNIGIVNYTWTVKNETYYGKTVKTRFYDVGTYEAVLKVRDAVGNVDTDVVNIYVKDYEDPVAIVGDDFITDEDEKVTLGAFESWDDYGIKTYLWTIEGNNYQGEFIIYNFKDPGKYKVNLKVIDFDDNYDTDSLNVTVRDTTPPDADAGGDITTEAGATVTLDGSNSNDNGELSNYTWMIDDKEFYGKTTNYTFENPREYDVYLRVFDKAEHKDEDHLKVFVKSSEPPTADAGDNVTVDIGEELTLNGSRSSDNVGIVSYEWDFGDGKIVYGKIVEHEFDEKGNYSIKLTVTDKAGNTDTDVVEIKVKGEDGDTSDGSGLFGYMVSALIIGIIISVAIYYLKTKD
ncbi:MAG: PKD domain-containing protein [Thermoplasmatota archaeon]